MRYEELKPGPVGERFAVIDYDGTQKIYYTPVDLDDPHIVMRGGLDPTEADPRFHQQMVYAVASETLQRFEVALGRRVQWARFDKPKPRRARGSGRSPTCTMAPPAMSFSSIRTRWPTPTPSTAVRRKASCSAISEPAPPIRAPTCPDKTVFTCLSHDIIAHETTHAIVGRHPQLFHRADQYRRGGVP